MRTRPGWGIVLVIAISVSMASCTDPGDAPDADPVQQITEATEVPVIPRPTEAAADDALAPIATPPAPDPRTGDVVLLHLEGPVTSPDATDVVVRSDRGVETDRFRLPDAVAVHAADGARWSLIETTSGQWARFDAATGSLALLTFQGDPPVGAPQIHGVVAVWDDPLRPWLVRLDSAESIDLRSRLEDGGRVVAATDTGSHLLIRGAQDRIISTIDGSTRELPMQASVSLSPDGSAVAAMAAGITGGDVYLEMIDGGGRQLVGNVEDLGVAYPLPDGGVLVLGPSSAILASDGTTVELPPAPGAVNPLLAQDGNRVIAAADDGLVLVDVTTATATTIPETSGYVVSTIGPGSVFWAHSADPEAPGLVVVNPATGTATTLLADTPTVTITSSSTDGRSVVVQTGANPMRSVLVTADGSVQPLGTGADATNAVVHPDGRQLAVALVLGTTRTLAIGDPTDPGVEVQTGRSPAWLITRE